MPPIIQIENLVHRFSDGTLGLDGISLDVEEGSFVVIAGANGSGKTTLAYLLMGCDGYVPSAGTVLYAGTDLLSLKIHERAKLGLTLAWQEPARFEGVTIREYLTLGRAALNPEPALAQVGLDPDRYLNRGSIRPSAEGNVTASSWHPCCA